MRESGLLLPGEYPTPWPTIANGRWQIPSSEYIVDYLVRRALTADDGVYFVDQDLVMGPEPGVIAIVYEVQTCDICQMNARGEVAARYDGPAGKKPDAAWAFMCEDCYLLHSTHTLGPGLGQYLLCPEEVPSDVMPAFRRARTYWTERGVRMSAHGPLS